MIYQIGRNRQEPAAPEVTYHKGIYRSGSLWWDEATQAGADAIIARVSEDLRRDLYRSRRGRMAWRLMRVYTTLARRLSRKSRRP